MAGARRSEKGAAAITAEGDEVEIAASVELRFSTTLKSKAVKKHCTGVLCLDNAFALIERHPRLHMLSTKAVRK